MGLRVIGYELVEEVVRKQTSSRRKGVEMVKTGYKLYRPIYEDLGPCTPRSLEGRDRFPTRRSKEF